MATNDLGDWYRSIPQITRYWFSGSVAVPLIARFGLVHPAWLVLHWPMFWYNFQIWRPISAVFYFPISPMTGFAYLINLYFLYSYSTRLETGLFDGRPADYAFMWLFNWLCCVIIGFILKFDILMDPMVLSVMYVWCQLNKDTIVNFWFGTQFKAMYLPWVLCLFNMIIRGNGMTELMGIFVGHLYFFLMFKYPQDFGGRSFLSTPQILYKWLPNRRGGVSGFGQAPSSRRGPGPNGGGGGGGGYNWGGTGHVLGGN